MYTYLSFFFIVLNVRDGSESKYPLIVFLSILYGTIQNFDNRQGS